MDSESGHHIELSSEERLEEIKKIIVRINCQTLWEKDRFVTDEQLFQLLELAGIKAIR